MMDWNAINLVIEQWARILCDAPHYCPIEHLANNMCMEIHVAIHCTYNKPSI